ncbi:MAG TPA: glycine oxidase ThiO [Blastocatellia bacterium]|nr:glycine oxidase ThiO [Blastocatellia bacterium]
MNKDAIIVGGGVIGCSIALKLAEAGLKVAVIERGRVGCEASRAAAGMLAAQSEATGVGPFFDLCLRSRAMYREFAAHLKDASGIDVEYKDEGMLVVVLEGEDVKESTRWASWQAEAGFPLERLSGSAIGDLEPGVTESATGAIFIPDDHQVENRRLMDALEVAIKRAGVELVEGKEVTRLLLDRRRIAGVACGTEHFNAGTVVVAAGSWSSALLEPLGLNVEVIPARGQMIAVGGRPCPIKRVLHSSKVYVVPRRDGRILIGATIEYAGFQKSVTVDGIHSLLGAATEVVPILKNFEMIESWAGLRPDTADHLPIIGPTGVENLFLATGHFRSGILLAPITAQLVAEGILSGSVPDELKPFGVERFRRGTSADTDPKVN